MAHTTDPIGSRPASEVIAAENEFFERLWYIRTMTSSLRDDPVAQDGIKRIEATYGDLSIDPADAAVVVGKLSALRWVLGNDWDFLDT